MLQFSHCTPAPHDRQSTNHEYPRRLMRISDCVPPARRAAMASLELRGNRPRAMRGLEILAQVDDFDRRHRAILHARIELQKLVFSRPRILKTFQRRRRRSQQRDRALRVSRARRPHPARDSAASPPACSWPPAPHPPRSAPDFRAARTPPSAFPPRRAPRRGARATIRARAPLPAARCAAPRRLRRIARGTISPHHSVSAISGTRISAVLFARQRRLDGAQIDFRLSAAGDSVQKSAVNTPASSQPRITPSSRSWSSFKILEGGV